MEITLSSKDVENAVIQYLVGAHNMHHENARTIFRTWQKGQVESAQEGLEQIRAMARSVHGGAISARLLEQTLERYIS